MRRRFSLLAALALVPGPAVPAPLSAALVSDPAQGKLTLNPDGFFAYAPTRNFAGTDRVVCAVTNAAGFADRATATIKVTDRPG